MANKAISELPQALNVNNQDLFVLEQSGIAKKLTAETFITEQGIIDALAEALDGHGGISSVTLSSVSGRIRTYLITFTDQSATTFQVLDGTSIDRITKTSTAGLVDTYTVFMSDGTTTFFTVTNGADGTVSEAMLNDALKDKAPAVTETTESSAIANFPDGADNMVMHNVVAEINPVQDLSNGDPSPSNICPISGWTGCNVTRTGKNLLKPLQSTDAIKYNGSGLVVSNVADGIAVRGQASGSGHAVGFIIGDADDYIGQTVTLSVEMTGSNATPQLNLLICDDALGSRSVLGYRNTTGSVSATIPQSASGKKLGVALFSTTGTDSESSISTYTNLQLELGSSATAYEPYQGETVSVDWSTEAGTVYGGTIDVATGLLTVNYGSYVFTGSESWTKGSYPWGYDTSITANGYSRQISGIKSSAKANIISDTFVLSSLTVANIRAAIEWSRVDCCINNVVGTDYIVIRYDSITDSTTFAQYMAGKTIVFDLATPQTYQLTPQQLMTLLGTNNVWADTGNVSVTYPADTKMFIEKLTMPTEDDLVANQAITSGKYFMIGNSLYLALANIASGAQITIGTNAQRVSLADALNTINS